MQLDHVFAPGGLVQPVDVLRHHGAELALLLELRKAQMRAVGPDALDHELFPVEAVVLLRVALEKAAAQDRLRRIAPLLVIQAVHAPEIGDPQDNLLFCAGICAASMKECCSATQFFSVRICSSMLSSPFRKPGDIIHEARTVGKTAGINIS